MSRPRRRVVKNPSWDPELWHQNDDHTAPFFYVPQLPLVQPPGLGRPPDKPLAFANPNSYGYGGGSTPWPFDMHRARRDGRYRAGIRNAINAKPRWTATNWVYVANKTLLWLENLPPEETFLQDGWITEAIAEQHKFIYQDE